MNPSSKSFLAPSFCMKRSLLHDGKINGEEYISLTFRLIRGDLIAQKIHISLMITRLETMESINYFILFHLSSEKRSTLFLRTHMRKIYIKMLSSQ